MSKSQNLLDSTKESFSLTEAGQILGLTRQQIAIAIEHGGFTPVKAWSRARPRIPRWQILQKLGLPYDSERYRDSTHAA
jgi:hypothetical protein